MRYRLGIEATDADHWLAWVFGLPGCYSSGHTRMEAISNAGASIAAYHQWIARHRQESPFDDPYMDIHVAEVFETPIAKSGLLPQALFDADRLALSPQEISDGLRLLEFTRGDLVAAFTQATQARDTGRLSGDSLSEIRALVAQLASTERDNTGSLGFALPKRALSGEPLDAIDRVRAVLREALTALAGDDRVVTHRGEMWSARKLVRRSLWHERDQTQRLVKLAGL